ncbi:MAG: hypothetical protein ACFFD4_02190 [Candidatus Odinarchaeota archaeon]
MTNSKNKANHKLPEIDEVIGIVTEFYNVFKEYLQKMVTIRIKNSQSAIWIDSIESIADFRPLFKNSSAEDIGKFYSLYMDYFYSISLLTRFNDLEPEEIEKAGEFLELSSEDIKAWESLQLMKLEAQGRDQ